MRQMPPTERPGEDVYTELLRAIILRSQASQPQEQPGELTTGRPARPRPGLTGLEQGQPELSPYSGRAESAVKKRADRLTLRTLAGASRDLFNLHMRVAEDLLKKGKFYAAAQEYGIAEISDQTNPLAPLGGAMALFGANEPRSAAVKLKASMTLSKLMMATGVEVAEMLGKEVVELRLGQLEQRIAEEGEDLDPSLVFLAAFIRSVRGETADAARLAGKLKAMAGEDELYKAYAEYLLKPKQADSSDSSPVDVPKEDD
jgi:hypothetical protein